HDVHIAYVNLIGTTALGITAGGWHPNHADNWIVEYCVFTGVASQALNVVNGKNITFRDDQFIDTGKLMANGVAYEGAACIDLEPNHPGDVIQNIDIERIYIHSGSSPFRPHGNGIII